LQLILFDFDGTLTRKDSLLEFFKFTHGKLHFVWNLLISLPIILIWKLGLINAENGKNLIFNIFYKNWSAEKLNEAGKAFAKERIPEILFDGAIDLVKSYQKNNNKIALVSASVDVYLKPFCQQYHIKCICTELAFEDGIYKGKFATKNCNTTEKVKRVVAVYQKSDFEKVVAYGNSSGDKAMMNWADESHFRYLEN
jgi:phosphatidylglycerophosphatase C